MSCSGQIWFWNEPWIRLLYSHPTASVRTNSQLSKSFDLHRGTRQGCPLSPMLFDLAIEPLAMAFRSCEDIAGIWRGSTQHKVSLYADDLLLFVSNPGTSLHSAMSLLNNFGQFSGYKINLGKSELFPINYEVQPSDLTNLPFKIEKNKLSYLGISVTRKYKDLFKENFIILLNQIKQTLTPLSMSLVGRINSIKMTKIFVPFSGSTSFYPQALL